jgi:hypothetical protein
LGEFKLMVSVLEQNTRRFATILFWETLENVPLVYGIVLALRWQKANLWLSLGGLIISIMLGVIAIHFTEHRKYSDQPTVKESWVNFITFLTLAVLIFFYFFASWSNWFTDVAAGIIVGAALAIGESIGWSNRASLKTHLPAMVIACTIVFSGLRFIHPLGLVPLLVMTGSITLVISIIISLMDYGRPRAETGRSANV